MRLCIICNKQLSIYNKKKSCFHHNYNPNCLEYSEKDSSIGTVCSSRPQVLLREEAIGSILNPVLEGRIK